METEAIGEVLFELPVDGGMQCGYPTTDLNETEAKLMVSSCMKAWFASLTRAPDSDHAEQARVNLQAKTAVNHTSSTIVESPVVPNNGTESIYSSEALINQLDNAELNKMDLSSLLTFLLKLAIANGHEQSKITAADSEFKKKTAIELRSEIKDNANSYGWMVWSAVGIVFSTAGMVGGIAMAQIDAQHAQNALQIGQLGNAATQPFVTYNQTADQTKQEEARHKQQMVGGDRQNQEQHSSSSDQTQQTHKQTLQSTLQSDHEAKSRMMN